MGIYRCTCAEVLQTPGNVYLADFSIRSNRIPPILVRRYHGDESRRCARLGLLSRCCRFFYILIIEPTVTFVGSTGAQSSGGDYGVFPIRDRPELVPVFYRTVLFET